MSPCRLKRPERELRNLGEDSVIKERIQTVEKPGGILFREETTWGGENPSLGLPNRPGALSLPEVQQVAEEAAGGASISLLAHGHQKEAMAQEGHMGSRHVREVKSHEEHLHHSLVGVK